MTTHATTTLTLTVDERRDDTGIERRSAVADLSYGAAVRFCRVTLSGRRITRSPEFVPNASTQRYTALSLSFLPQYR